MASIVKFCCPKCNALFEVSIDLSGQIGECENCNCEFTIPQPVELSNIVKEKATSEIKEESSSDCFLDNLFAPTHILDNDANLSSSFNAKKDDILFSNGIYDIYLVYMRDINRISQLTSCEESIIGEKANNGDLDARNVLVKSNLRLVAHIAKSYFWANMDIMDLIQEGNIGLMRAAEKYDPTKGAKFSSYAAWWINQAIKRYIGNFKEIIRIPIQSNTKINKINKESKTFFLSHNRPPAIDELTDITGFSKRTVSTLLTSNIKVFPFAGISNTGYKYSLYSYYRYFYSSHETPEFILSMKEVGEKINCLLPLLENKERYIIEERLGLLNDKKKTLEDVSLLIQRTRERVRQIENKALNKLKIGISDDFLSDYSWSINYHPNNTLELPDNTNKNIDEYIKQIIFDIFDKRAIPLTLRELEIEVKQNYPSSFISSAKIRKILKTPLFLTMKTTGHSKLYQLREWEHKTNQSIPKKELDFFNKNVNLIEEIEPSINKHLHSIKDCEENEEKPGERVQKLVDLFVL